MRTDTITVILANWPRSDDLPKVCKSFFFPWLCTECWCPKNEKLCHSKWSEKYLTNQRQHFFPGVLTLFTEGHFNLSGLNFRHNLVDLLKISSKNTIFKRFTVLHTDGRRFVNEILRTSDVGDCHSHWLYRQWHSKS